jgi:beta-lactamase regulating signal transducer with metallopeptidase domain
MALGNAAVVVVLTPVVAIAAFVFRRRPAVVHVLWLMLLVKLVTPPIATIELALPWPDREPTALSPPAQPRQSPATAFVRADLTSEEPDDDQAALPVPGAPVAESPVVESEVADCSVARPAPRPPLQAMAASRSFWRVAGEVAREQSFSWLMRLWLFGSLCWCALSIVRVGRFTRLIGQTSKCAVEPQRRAENLCARLGIRRSPEVSFVAGAMSPVLWALGTRPRLLIPELLWKRLDCDQRDGLLVHELAHLRRRDHWVRCLELLVGAVYWWHPVAWWARRCLREAEEQCCDAWVVWALPEKPRSYATALVESVEFLSVARGQVPLGASGLGQFRHLSRRIAMIMKGKTPRTVSWAGLFCLLALAAVLLPWMPSFAKPLVAPQAAPVSVLILQEVEQAPGQVQQSAQSNDALADAADEKELLEIQIQTKRVALKRARAQLDRDRNVADRAKKLGATGAMSRELVDKVDYDVSVSEDLVATREAELREAELKARVAERRLNRLRQTRIAPHAFESSPASRPAQKNVRVRPVPSDSAEVNRLKQIGLALHNYLDVHGTFPPAAMSRGDDSIELSWRVAILPFLGQGALYEEFHLNEPWDSPHNKALLAKMPDVFDDANGAHPEGMTPTQAIVGPGTCFDGTKGIPISEILDGTSNTIVVANNRIRLVPWTKPEDLGIDDAITTAMKGARSAPIGPGSRVLFADGSVRTMNRPPTGAYLRAVLTRAGGEVIPPDEMQAPGANLVPGPGGPMMSMRMATGGDRAPGGMPGMGMSGMMGPGAGAPQPRPETVGSPDRSSRGAMMGGMSMSSARYGTRGGIDPASLAPAPGGMPGTGAVLERSPTAPQSAERRISELEKKVDQLLKELESLRKDRQTAH